MVLGSIFLLLMNSHTIPSSAAKATTKTELAELLTPLGSSLTPKTVFFKFSEAKALNDPPLCSKKAQNTMENKIKTKAANSFLFSAFEKFLIS
jgi:hypothetical protein